MITYKRITHRKCRLYVNGIYMQQKYTYRSKISPKTDLQCLQPGSMAKLQKNVSKISKLDSTQRQHTSAWFWTKLFYHTTRLTSTQSDTGIQIRISGLIQIPVSAGSLSKCNGFMPLSTSVIFPSFVKIGWWLWEMPMDRLECSILQSWWK